MCIAIFKPNHVTLTKKVLKTCFNNNPHGAGFAYPDNPGVVIEKGFFGFREFWARYAQVQKKKRPMIIHFRVATSGIVDKKNCHPWKIDNDHALIHNGVVQDKIGIESKDCSDTGLFAEHILKPTFERGNSVWKTDAYKWLIEQSIGKKNKMVIMDKDGSHVIFNEKEGEWEHGAWFSNDTFKNARKSMVKLRDTWLETRDDGRIFSVKKRGEKKTYTEVKAPIITKKFSAPVRSTADQKIMSFASRQTGVHIGPPKLSIAPVLPQEQEVVMPLEGSRADISAMF